MVTVQNNDGADLYVALLHYPVLNKAGDTIASAVTPLDLHDISRAARTYGVHRFFVVTPLTDQQNLVQTVIDHWMTGYGATYNPARSEALKLVELADTLESVKARIRSLGHGEPVMVVTSSRDHSTSIDFQVLRRMVGRGDPHLLIFGTAWGLAPEVIEKADFYLQPIRGSSGYNHLSVRSAATVILDRLLGG
jgi:hypothetical protein